MWRLLDTRAEICVRPASSGYSFRSKQPHAQQLELYAVRMRHSIALVSRNLTWQAATETLCGLLQQQHAQQAQRTAWGQG